MAAAETAHVAGPGAACRSPAHQCMCQCVCRLNYVHLSRLIYGEQSAATSGATLSDRALVQVRRVVCSVGGSTRPLTHHDVWPRRRWDPPSLCLC